MAKIPMTKLPMVLCFALLTGACASITDAPRLTATQVKEHLALAHTAAPVEKNTQAAKQIVQALKQASARSQLHLSSEFEQTLTALIAQTLANNPSLAQAQLRIEQAQQELGITQAAVHPSVVGTASVNRSRPAALSGAQAPITQTASLGFMPQWELDLWGARQLQAQADAQSVQSAKLAFQASQVSLAFAVSQLALQWSSLQAELQATALSLQYKQDVLQAIEARVRAGLSPVNSLSQAQQALEQVLSAQSALQLAQSKTLNAMVALGVGTESALVTLLQKTEPLSQDLVAPSNTITGSLATTPGEFSFDALAQRPDIHSAIARYEAAASLERAAHRAQWPSIDLTGNVAWSILLANPGNVALAFGAALQSSGLLIDPAREQKLALPRIAADNAQQDVRQAVLTAQQELTDTLAAVGTEQFRFESAIRNESLAKDIVAREALRFQAGLTPPAQWFAAQDQAVLASRQRMVAELALLSAQWNLSKAAWADLPTNLTPSLNPNLTNEK